jgi:hypothetical protein
VLCLGDRLNKLFFVSVIYQIAYEDTDKSLKSLNPSTIRESVRNLNVKNRIKSLAIVAVTVAIALVNNMEMGSAKPPTKPPIPPDPYILSGIDISLR